MASGNLIGCKVHGLALAYSSMDGWVCIMFSKKTFYIYIYIYIYLLYIPSIYVCFQKNTRESWGNAWVVGYNCLHNQVCIYMHSGTLLLRHTVLAPPFFSLQSPCPLIKASKATPGYQTQASLACGGQPRLGYRWGWGRWEPKLRMPGARA